MTPEVFKVIELAGQSSTGIEDAVQNALKRANQTIQHIRWFEVVETRGHVENGNVAQWQVVVKIGFGLEE